MKQARFLQEAEDEFLAEVAYYAEVQTRGAERFWAAVEEATARALTFPMAGLHYMAKTRRVFVKGYPFFLVYLPEPTGVAVMAVVHESRRPGYWLSRTA
jgi:plasmid stabilization system protein ParE